MDDTIAAHLAGTDATTIALFSVTHGSKGALATTQTGYRRITGPIGRQIIADAHDGTRRVDVTYTSFGRSKNASLFASTAIQDRVIAGLVGLRRELGVDGVAVDVEEIDNEFIPAFGAFVGRLRAALREDAPGATVTVATGAGRQGVALALSATLAGADRIFLMGYDYRTGGSEPGATSPLGPVRRDGDERTLAWSVDLYAATGVPADRTILGLPLYGVAWPVATADLGATATGKGKVWVPRQNLATLRDPTLVQAYDGIEDVAFVAVPDGSTWRAVYYETPQSLTPKLRLADDQGFAGAGLWALGYERGLPAFTDLIAAFRAGRLASAAP
jgi:spore germination protein YaaH